MFQEGLEPWGKVANGEEETIFYHFQWIPLTIALIHKKL